MSTSCLSTASIVRCETLTQLQNGIAFVPVAVQMVFLLTVSAFYCHSGRRKHYWLLAEGVTFYIVTLIDLLSHLIPVARSQLHVFRIFDIVIGVLSFVPIIFYLFFIVLFSSRFYFDAFTGRISIILKYVLMSLIPITIATSELGSFLGIRYQAFENAAGEMLLGIGFSSSTLQTLFRLFASITLVLLILYQAFFFISSVYVGASLIQERRVGSNFFEGFTMPTMAGIIWLAIGIKFGFVESILGFVSGGFPIVLTRRLLRMFCRCCLVVGSLQSESASATIVDRNGRPRSTSQIRAMISNPRHSTFVRLSPSAGAFYSARAAEKLPEGFVSGATHASPTPRNQRVTVHYDGRYGPHLELRLSGLDVPPAEVLTAQFNRRGTIFENIRSAKPSLTRSLSAIAPPTVPMLDPEAFPASLRPVLGSRSMTTSAGEGFTRSSRGNPRYRSSGYNEDEDGDGSFILTEGHRRFMSASSIASDSLSVVRALASQFPGLPPRRTASSRRWSVGGGNRRSSIVLSAALENVTEVNEKTEANLSPSSSIKRKPPPTLEATMSELKSTSEEFQASHSSQSDQSKLSHSSSMRRRNNHVPPPIDISQAGPEDRLSQSVVLIDDNDDEQPHSALVAVSTNTATTPTGSRTRTRHKPDYSYSTVRSSNTATRSQPTPGMTVGGLTSSPDEPGLATDREVFVANPSDTFEDTDEDQPRYKVSQLAGAESGLNRMAARVVEFDRMRRESYLKKPPVPSRPDAKGKGKGKASEMGRVDFPRVAGKSIGGPKPLSALAGSSSSSSNPPSPRSPSYARRVNASRGPDYTSPSPASPLKSFHQQHPHQHTVSQSSVATRRSHTDREMMQVKQVGLVPTRRTPTPTPSTNSFATRKSMRIDSIDYSVSGRSATLDSELDTEGSTGGASPMRGAGHGPSIANLRGARYRYEGRGWGARGSVSSGLSRLESEAAFKHSGPTREEGMTSDMEDNGRSDS